jgi:glutamate synthase (NADPH/NADH) small chain
MDVARTIKKLGAKKVTVVYRRSENEMPAEIKEIAEAKEEGIEFLLQTNILEIKGQDKVEELECIKTELIQKEGETRLSPVNIEGSNFTIKTDYIMMAVGSHPEESITKTLNISLDKKGRIEVNENNQTSNEKIFAGGDISGSEATVAFAARSGRNAANSIIEYLNNKSSN